MAAEEYRTVTMFRAPDDGRVVAILVRGDFDEYEKFRPFITTEDERQHMLTSYVVEDPVAERTQKAHLTDDEWPLQLVILHRDPGATTLPHYHVNERPSQVSTRHQVLICQRGEARVGVYTTSGTHVATVNLKEHDVILMAEGHAVEFVTPDTKLIEIKQGPFPETDAADKVDLTNSPF